MLSVDPLQGSVQCLQFDEDNIVSGSWDTTCIVSPLIHTHPHACAHLTQIPCLYQCIVYHSPQATCMNVSQVWSSLHTECGPLLVGVGCSPLQCREGPQGSHRLCLMFAVGWPKIVRLLESHDPTVLVGTKLKYPPLSSPSTHPSARPSPRPSLSLPLRPPPPPPPLPPPHKHTYTYLPSSFPSTFSSIFSFTFFPSFVPLLPLRVTGSYDKSVRVWSTSSWECAAVIGSAHKGSSNQC